MELISVIIPVYNIAQFIEKCLISVCRQTYHNLEIILVDDGSSDDSGKICERYRKKDPRIRVVHKENGGLSSARNAGLDIASGEYIYFLDGDDYIEPELLEQGMKFFKEGIDLVVFNYRWVTPDGKSITQSQFIPDRYDFNDPEKKSRFICNFLLSYKMGWEAWNRIYRREKIKQYGLRFENNKEIFAEDLYFCLCYCSHITSVQCIDSVLYNYVQRKGSIMDTDKKLVNVGRISKLGEAVYRHYMQYDDCQYLLDIFPAIFYCIIKVELDKVDRISPRNYPFLRNAVIKYVDNADFFALQISGLYECLSVLSPTYSYSFMAEQVCFFNYCFTGRYKIFWIKKGFIRLFSKIINHLSSRLLSKGIVKLLFYNFPGVYKEAI